MLEELLHGLKKVGLEEKEGRVYLALLTKPGSTVQMVANAADLPRASCYDILDALQERGFIFTGEGEHAREYYPQSPEYLTSLLRLEEKKISERIREAENFVPMLTVLYNPSGAQPRVRYKEGVKGLKEIQKEYELLSGDIIQIVGYDAFMALHDPQAKSEHREEILKKEKRVRSIIVTEHPEKFKDLPSVPFVEIRVLPSALFSIEGEMTICEDRVLFFSYAVDMIALEVRSPAIAGTCRATLELAWKQAGDILKTF